MRVLVRFIIYVCSVDFRPLFGVLSFLYSFGCGLFQAVQEYLGEERRVLLSARHRWCYPWCGFCYENQRGRANHKGHFGYFLKRKVWDYEMAMQFVRKRVSSDGRDDSSPAPCNDERTAKEMPALLEFCTCVRWDDGAARETGTLFIFWEEGFWKCCVNDRDSDSIAFISKERLADLLKAVDAGLQKDSLDWRRSRGKKGGRK